MAYSIQIDETSKEAKAFLAFVKKLEFVVGVHKIGQKEQLLMDLTESFNDIKLHKTGKKKLKSAKDLLNGI